MAHEIKTHFLSDEDLYALLIRTRDGQVFNGTTFEGLDASHWVTYAIDLVEQGTTAFYYGNMPEVAPGLYDVFVFSLAGDAPDPSDSMISQGTIDWSGNQDVGVNSIHGGNGIILVDHDYGGAGRLTYQTAYGVGVPDGSIIAYLTSDFLAGRRGNAYVIARTTTTANGLWERPMMLDPGDYTLLYFKQGVYTPTAAQLHVS